jgi:hypothetical protein
MPSQPRRRKPQGVPYCVVTRMTNGDVLWSHHPTKDAAVSAKERRIARGLPENVAELLVKPASERRTVAPYVVGYSVVTA